MMAVVSAIQVKGRENKTRLASQPEREREINGEDLQLRHNVNTKKDTRPKTRLLVLTIFFWLLLCSRHFSFPFVFSKSLRIRMRFAVRAIFLPKMVDRLNSSSPCFSFFISLEEETKTREKKRERLLPDTHTERGLGVGGKKTGEFGSRSETCN